MHGTAAHVALWWKRRQWRSLLLLLLLLLLYEEQREEEISVIEINECMLKFDKAA
jgi:hypothetical protein